MVKSSRLHGLSFSVLPFLIWFHKRIKMKQSRIDFDIFHDIFQVESQILILDMWRDSLNSLTWTEILRQILVAAGYGSVKCAVQSEDLSKVLI